MSRLILLWVAVAAALCSCSSDGAPTRHDDFTPLTSIEIVATAPAIATGTSTPLTVMGNFSGQFTRDITDQAVWSSGTPAVAEFATPQNPNRITGRAPGTAVLTATVGSVSATFTLTVTPATVTTLTITPDTTTIPKGLTTQFAVRGTFSDATTQDLTFDASWGSSAPDVATVGDAPGTKGLAKGLAAGTTTISATFAGANATTPLTVTDVALQSISLSPESLTLLTLSSRSFSATGKFSDGTSADITGQVTWSSSRTDIATIAANGTASTLVPGTTTISASLNGVTGTAGLKVTGGTLTGMTVSPASARLVKGTATPISVTGTFSNGGTRDITGAVAWSVASPLVASVTPLTGNGALLNALAVTPVSSSIKVTAKSGTVSADSTLTVSAPVLRSIAISSANLALTTGTSGRFAAIATFGDGSTQDVTASTEWTSNATGTAPVDDTGLARGRVHGIAVTAGPVTISAAYGGLTATAPVTVTNRTVVSLAVSGYPAVTIATGNQVRFTATATYADGSSLDVTEDATWSVDQPSVAILADAANQPGQVVGVDTGKAGLTASFGGKTQTVTLTVQ